MKAEDKDYYAQRAQQARALEKEAADPRTARIHAEMAEEYEKMLQAAEEDSKL